MCKPPPTPPPRKKTEEEELKECFDYFDKDGSGTISLYEMRQTMFEIAAQIGEELSLEEVQESHFVLSGFPSQNTWMMCIHCAYSVGFYLEFSVHMFRTGAM